MTDNRVSSFKYFMAGASGGICTTLVGHPMDTVKVRLQTMPRPKPGEAPLYTGTFDCVKKTIKFEGFTGLYKGMGAPLVGVSPLFAVSFLGYGVGQRLQQSHPDEELNLAQLALAGAFSGIGTSLIMAPGERIKSLLQIQHNSVVKLYDGPLDCVKKLYKSGGIASIYRGFGATLLRDIPACGVYFMTYDCLKRAMAKEKNEALSIGKTILAGGTAGVINWLVALPADVLKSNYQTAPEGTYKNGIRDVFKHVMKQDGIKGLYRGATPVLIRAFPANASCFIGFEVTMLFMNYIEKRMASS